MQFSQCLLADQVVPFVYSDTNIPLGIDPLKPVNFSKSKTMPEPVLIPTNANFIPNTCQFQLCCVSNDPPKQNAKFGRDPTSGKINWLNRLDVKMF